MSPSEVQITILESDYPYGRFSFSDSSYYLQETPPNTDPTQYNSVSITIQRLFGTLSEVSLSWRVQIADNNTDVSPLEGTVIFSEGTTFMAFVVAILPDDIPEIAETFIIFLHSPTGGAAIDPTAYQVSHLILIY